MSNLTPNQIEELSDSILEGCLVVVERGESRGAFRLAELRRHGMKGVVWRGSDDLGNDVAVKFIPLAEYVDISLTDEMTEASKLGSDYFAAIKFFGDARLPDTELSGHYKCVVTEWIEAESLDRYLEDYPFTVEDFLILSEKLFSALAVLRNTKLCHDDLHPGNVLLHKTKDPLTKESILTLKVIDTGTIKRIDTRDRLLTALREKVSDLQSVKAAEEDIKSLKDLLYWKTPDDHLRAVECLLFASNALVEEYSRLDFWERRFIDNLKTFFDRLTDEDLGRRLDEPSQVVNELRVLVGSSKRQDYEGATKLSSPFDYISAEMIRNDKEFAELFSKECPWLEECKALEPLYIYGPRGCGKSSVLRWLSFKTIVADPSRCNISDLREIGVYVSCSVELRSRFWLLADDTINELQIPIIRFFNLLLLEGLFDTLGVMAKLESEGSHSFGLSESDQHGFCSWTIGRMNPHGDKIQFRLQGQDYFS
jgi:serine/threonine protein kinase